MWEFVLTDRNYVPLGEILNATGRTVSLALSRMDTCGLSVLLNNPLSDAFLACDGYIKAYRNRQLQFYGPIVSAEETVERGKASVAVNAASPAWFLQKRPGTTNTAGRIISERTDRAKIVKLLIDDTNVLVPGDAFGSDTGIATTGPIDAASSTTYKVEPHVPIWQILTEMAQTQYGFEWRMMPIDNYDEGMILGSKIASFEARPTWGSVRTEAIFEYGAGTRANVQSYRRPVTRDAQANFIWQTSASAPNNPLYASDPTSSTIYKWLVDRVDADTSDAALRNALLAAHLQARSFPKQVVEFVPHLNDGSARVPTFGMDYDLGDIIKFRSSVNNVTRVDAFVRAYGATFTISDAGTETLALKVINDEASN